MTPAFHTPKPASIKSVADTFEDDMLRFLDLSREITTLVQHENLVLLEKGELSYESYVKRKMTLMGDFEKKARNLLSALTGRTNKLNAQIVLVEEIRRVRDALRVNTGFQLETIRARMREKISQSEDNGLFCGAQEEGSLCH